MNTKDVNIVRTWNICECENCRKYGKSHMMLQHSEVPIVEIKLSCEYLSTESFIIKWLNENK